MTPNDRAALRADLGDLVDDLRQAEFGVGLSEAIDATALLGALARRGTDLNDTALVRARLRPVFCKSADQQRAFDAIFDQWWARARKEDEPLPPPPPPSPPPAVPDAPWTQGVIVALFVVALVLATGYVVWRRETPRIGASVANSTASTTGVPVPPTPAKETATPPVPSGPPTVLLDRLVPAQRANVEIRPWWVWLLAGLPLIALFTVTLPALVLSRTRLRARGDPMMLDPRPLEREARRLVPSLQADIGDRLARHVPSRGIDIERQARRPMLDIPRTIDATLRNHGVPTLRFSLTRVHPSYLVLIDDANEHDPRGRLFYQWAERLQREGLDVELLVLRRMEDAGQAESLRVCAAAEARRSHARWLPMRRLREPKFGERLIVISDGDPLVDAHGRWRPDAVRARLHRWRDRVVFTPVEPRDWGEREDALERLEGPADPGFIVLPLDESALGAWTDLVLTGQLSPITLADPQRFPALLRKDERHRFEADEAPPAEELERLVEQLYFYLGDRGSYWLAAIAVTPVIRWDLTLLIGKAALGKLPRLSTTESLNASLARNYRRLVRLPWLRRQSMPDWLRLRLLFELSHSQQGVLREEIGRLLADLQPHAIPDGIQLDFERPTGQGRPRGERAPRDAEVRRTDDRIYLGYLSGLTPEQLLLRAPREWRAWASKIPLRREPGFWNAVARLRDRVRATLAPWVWSGGLPHAGLSPRQAIVALTLIVPLAIGLATAARKAPTALLTANRFFSENVHQQRIRTPSPVRALVSSPDGARIWSGHDDGTVRLWDAQSGRALGVLRGHTTPVTQMALFNRGAALVALAADHTVRTWNVETMSALGSLRGIWLLARPPAGEGFALLTSDGRLGVDVSPQAAAASGPRIINATIFAVNADRRYAAFGAADGTVTFDALPIGLAQGAPIRGHTGAVLCIAFSPDGTRAASGGADGAIRLWDARQRVLGQRLPGHEGPVTSVAFTPDGTRLISAGADGTVRLWDVATGQPQGTPLKGHDGSVAAVAISARGQAVTAGDDGTIRLWDSALRLLAGGDVIRAAAADMHLPGDEEGGSRQTTGVDDVAAHVSTVQHALLAYMTGMSRFAFIGWLFGAIFVLYAVNLALKNWRFNRSLHRVVES